VLAHPRPFSREEANQEPGWADFNNCERQNGIQLPTTLLVHCRNASDHCRNHGGFFGHGMQRFAAA
jgi:hypothetical protein